MAYINDHRIVGSEAALPDAALLGIMGTLLDTPRPALRGRTVRSVLGTKEGLTYFGMTFRSLREEAWGFLAKRGAERQKENGEWTSTGARALPAITWANGDCISPMDAVCQLGFATFFVYQSTIKANVTRMESLLQAEFHHLRLGRRLWRVVGAGSQFASAEEAAGRKVLYKVYVTCSLGFDFAGKGVVVNMRSTTGV